MALGAGVSKAGDVHHITVVEGNKHSEDSRGGMHRLLHQTQLNESVRKVPVQELNMSDTVCVRCVSSVQGTLERFTHWMPAGRQRLFSPLGGDRDQREAFACAQYHPLSSL